MADSFWGGKHAPRKYHDVEEALIHGARATVLVPGTVPKTIGDFVEELHEQVVEGSEKYEQMDMLSKGLEEYAALHMVRPEIDITDEQKSIKRSIAKGLSIFGFTDAKMQMNFFSQLDANLATSMEGMGFTPRDKKPGGVGGPS